MASKRKNSQAFIGRNRPPRVQITYDHETLGANRKVELPFVLGVMADLSGKGNAELPALGDRNFREVRQETFDDFLKKSSPAVQFAVPNKLTGEGRMAVELNFESMDDFSPAGVAKNVEPLRRLLDARSQLYSLLRYMDGKAGAEKLLNELLANPAKLKQLLEGRAEAKTHAANKSESESGPG